MNRKLLVLILISLVGVFTILYSTKWGIGMGHDQLGYVQGAENLVRGNGYSHLTPLGELRPTLQWPPFYSFVLATFGFFGIGILEGARFLNALLFGVNIFLVGYFVYLKSDFWPAVFGSCLILTAEVMLMAHSMAMSEPLYILLGLCALYFLDSYLSTSRLRFVILSALLIGAACLTRYIGVTLVATLCVAVLAWGKAALRQRLVHCLIAGLIGSMPLWLWQLRNHQVAGKVSNQHLQLHLIKLRHFKEGLYTVAVWLLPARLAANSKILVLFGILAGIFSVLLIAWWRKQKAPTLVYLNATYISIYCLGLVFFISFVSLDLAFDARYLSPVFVSGVIIGSLSLHQISRELGRTLTRGLIVLCLVFISFYAVRAIGLVRKVHQDGLGWEGRLWKQSELISVIKNLPPDTVIYANYATGIAYLSQRKIGDLPVRLDEHTENPSPDYLKKLQEIGAASRTRPTVIIYLNVFRPHFVSENELKQVLSLRKITTTPEASVYQVSN